jgi:hypothetical protein
MSPVYAHRLGAMTGIEQPIDRFGRCTDEPDERVAVSLGPTASRHANNRLVGPKLDLGLEAGRSLGVPQPLAALTREIVQSMIGNGYQDIDFGALLELQAKACGLELKSEKKAIDDGLGG